MGWGSVVFGAICLTLILIFTAVTIAGYLVVTHQNCSPSFTASGYSDYQLFGQITYSSSASSDSTSGAAPSALPLPTVSSDLSLAPLADLSLVQGHDGNYSAITDLAEPSYWQEIHDSEYVTYEQMIPQTVMGFFNSSQTWKQWALQYIPDSPDWLSMGFVKYADGQVMGIDRNEDGGNGTTQNATAVGLAVQDFAASAAGVTLASLDFVSFNGLTALQTYFETDDPLAAVCQTLPGQLAQLYTSSFDPSIPATLRAQYLGRALAVTSVMLIIGGKDGFSDQFQTALDGLGLDDSWATVKPYLGDITTRVSASASSATFAILETLAQRFPQDSTFVAGFTADRIDSMVDVLQKKGISDGVIQSDIGEVAQVAGAPSDEEATGDEADVLSFQQGDGIRVLVNQGGDLARYEDSTGKTVTLSGEFLQQIIPGFDPRGPEIVQVHYGEAGVTVYQYYQAKGPIGAPYSTAETNWYPVVPADIGKPGDILTISLDLLTTDEFLESVPPIVYPSNPGINWVTSSSELAGFDLSGNHIQMDIQQQSFQGISSFSVDVTPDTLSSSNGDTFLTFNIPNFVDTPRTFKVTFDGYGDAALSIGSGSNFSPVTLISSDGVRLKFVSNSGGSAITVSPLYLQDPSILYTPGAMVPTDSYSVAGASQFYQINQITLNRGIEQSILDGESKYDIGIVGAEIAYSIGEKTLDLQGIQMPPVSQGGADLYTSDGEVIMQARMLANPLTLGDNLQVVLTGQLDNMVNKLVTDFPYHTEATTGYAILSYVDPTTHQVKTIVAVVPKP